MQLSAPTCLTLLYTVQVWLGEASGNLEPNMGRRKRAWIMRPKLLKENTDYSHLEFIAKIWSDQNEHGNIDYSLQGKGANQEPYNVFTVNPRNGYIQLKKKLDRERIDSYHLLGVATYEDGTEAEEKMDILIKVVDENDNIPVFPIGQSASINELSPPGTFVMKVNATDADEPGNPNSQIKYSILSEDPPEGMFYITKDGKICVHNSSLDRERTQQYILKIKGQDLNGLPGGNIGTGSVTINVLDVNDNPPTLEKDVSVVYIEENSQVGEVLRLKAEDLDQRGTANWEVVYDIVKGNEAEHFSIHTDPKTNEGVLILEKPLDYENVKNHELSLTVRNKAPMSDGLDQAITISVIANVINQVEGPHFDPEVKAIPIREGSHITDVIAHYPATNLDTNKPAENVRYVKGSDPDNWLIIDPETADIRLNKLPDRESPFLINGTYYAKVLCITEEMPPQTATGTVAIQVEDFNDNCPTLTSTSQVMCTDKRAVLFQAHDDDPHPNGPPLKFSIVQEGLQEKWKIEHMNDTAVILRAPESTWPGSYKIQFLIQDEQGKACAEPQIVKVLVCTCKDGVRCGDAPGNGRPRRQVSLGTACIGLIILGLLLLLLLPLCLLFCKCGHDMIMEISSEDQSSFLKYNSEGLGDKPGPLVIKQTEMSGILGASLPSTALGTAPSRRQTLNRRTYDEGAWESNIFQVNRHTSFYNGSMDSRDSISDGIGLPYSYLQEYITQKVSRASDHDADMDIIRKYHYGRQDSPAGSLGCCSLVKSDNDLSFLDDITEAKFKKLAEVCGGLITPTDIQRRSCPDLRQHPSAHMIGSAGSAAGHLSGTPHVNAFTTEESVVKATLATQKGAITAEKTAAEKGQTILLHQQQPIYCASNPMQTVQYVVQPQVPAAMIITEPLVTNFQSVGLDSDAALTTNTKAMVLVERCQQQGNMFNLIQPQHLPVAQTMTGHAVEKPLKMKASKSKFVSAGHGENVGVQSALLVEGIPSTKGNRQQKVEGLPQRQVFGSQRCYQVSSKATGAPVETVSRIPTKRMVDMKESEL